MAASTHPPRAVVIEDDRDIAHLVREALGEEGFAVVTAHDGVEGFREALDPETELVVLDLLLPGMGGLEICRRLRVERSDLLILMLTAKTSEVDRVLGLELGADDYLTKPFSLRELQARSKALRRRKQAFERDHEEEVVVLGALELDAKGQSLRVHGKAVHLTQREFELLVHFARHPGRVFSREELLDAVWGAGFDGFAHTVNSHINRLRNKIEVDPGAPEWIQTVWGRGYKFVPSAE